MVDEILCINRFGLKDGLEIRVINLFVLMLIIMVDVFLFLSCLDVKCCMFVFRVKIIFIFWVGLMD